MRIPLLLASTAVLAFSLAASADTIAGTTAGQDVDSGFGFIGQSFTVTGTGTYTSIVFNFYAPSGASFAEGDGYLFSQAYGGSPTTLNPSAPGFMGEAAAADGVYRFDPSMTLTAGAQYFLYLDAEVSPFLTGASYDGGQMYQTFGGRNNFDEWGYSADFNVAGNGPAAVTPEPSSLVLLGTGILGVVAMTRRRFSR